MGAFTEAGRSGARRGLWAEILILGIAYYGVGRLAWFLVPTPGQALALWPPAGLALGWLLLRGLAVAPGVFLGAGLLGLQAVLMSRAVPLPRALILAGAIGAGATLEPVLAALAVRRFIELPLRTARHALTFAALAGPAPAAIGALACTGALFWGGLLPRSALASSIGVWWVGDAMGALVFAPLVMLLGARGGLPARQRLSIAAIVLSATAVGIWVFVQAGAWDEARSRTVLRQRATAIAVGVERSLTYHLDALRTLADFAGNDGRLDPTSFQRMATGAVVRHFSFEALAWAPAAFDGRPAVLTVVEPSMLPTSLSVGMDLMADAEVRAKLSTARRTGEPVLLPLDARRTWVFMPAPGRSGENGINGFFGAVLRLDLLVERAAAEIGGEGVALEFHEGAHGRPLLFRAPASAGNGPFVPLTDIELPISLADHPYVVVPLASRAAVIGQHNPQVWVVLLACMLFVALLQGVLLVGLGRPHASLAALPYDEMRAASGRQH
jgi:hypothetical protein